jgi:negative regulator of sigma E activity
MARSAPWLLLLCCAVLGATIFWFRRTEQQAHADGRSAREWVEAAWGQGEKVGLSGVKQIQMRSTKQVVDARIVVSPDGRSRIEYLSEPLRGVIIWEDRERTYRYNPKLKRLTVAHRRITPREQDRLERQLLQNYNMQILGSGTVANRPAVEVELRPKSGIRRTKRIWIDRTTFVILGSEDHNDRGILRRTAFREIRYLSADESGKLADSEFRPSDEMLRRYGTARPGDTSSRFDPEGLSSLVGFRVREPHWLPNGYTLEGAYQSAGMSGAHHPGARLVYTDGMNTVSLFESDHAPAQPDSKENEASPLTYRYAHDGILYVAVGDAPREDLKRIVHSAANGAGTAPAP